jgi:hypothetical protein
MATKSVVEKKKPGKKASGRTSGSSGEPSRNGRAKPAESGPAGRAASRSASSSPTEPASSPSARRSGGGSSEPTVEFKRGDGTMFKGTISEWERDCDARLRARGIDPNDPWIPTDVDVGADPAAQRIIVDVPTLIGALCGSKYELSAVRCDVSTDGSALLQACDGHKAAIVVTTSEIGRKADAAAAKYIPAELARPSGRSSTALRFANNPNKSELFDTEFAWVDGERGVYRQQPDIPKFPAVADIFPDMERDPVEPIVVGLNAEALLQLAKAVNSPGAPEGVGSLVLIIRPPTDRTEGVDKPIAVVGSCGIGVMLPSRPIRSAALSTYSRVRKLARVVLKGGDVGDAPDLGAQDDGASEPKAETEDAGDEGREAAFEG